MRHAIVKLTLAALVLCLPLLAASASAQGYPNRPVRFIVPFPAGGVADGVARVFGQKLGELLGQQVVIENRPGASGTIGVGEAVRAPADGYTLLLTTGDFITTPSLMPAMNFDPGKDLVPITMVATAPLLLVANSNAPFGTIKELFAAAKSNPGKIAYSSPGNGTINHLAGEWLAIEGGVKLLHVPYRGGAPAATGVAAGDVALGVVTPSSGIPLIDAGKVKVLALMSQQRPSFAPAGWPTMADNALPIDAALWVGLFAPAATSPAIVSRLNDAAGRVLQDAAVRDRLHALGTEPSPISQAAFVESIRNTAARYTRIIEQTGVRIER
jgi:tripartite-type tricarboxylate transporter receptor subunit TctC